ncbi:MAG: inositol-monophosphatase [Nitrospirae bacterium]|nr:inositol-monophosphatase [Nitrospirota bacterium]
MNRHPGKEFLTTAVTAARISGDIILKNLGRLSTSDIQSKQAFDFVTKVDRWSEAVIMKTIREKFPHHLFLSEETLQQKGNGDYRWIIDPLDGTTNFIHGFPVFSVSVALEYKKEIILGVVFDPLRDELFHATKCSGTFLNNTKVRVSDTKTLENSLIATGFPFRKKEMIDDYLNAFKHIFERVSDIRRAGSAAIDLAYIAAGRVEGFFELNLSPWDIAAGGLLITEAGGSITDFEGGEQYLLTGNIVAGNIKIHAEILQIIKQVFHGVI